MVITRCDYDTCEVLELLAIADTNAVFAFFRNDEQTAFNVTLIENKINTLKLLCMDRRVRLSLEKWEVREA